MKRLRILTGRHVGSMLPIASGVHRVGAEQHCDVAVSDWDTPTLHLIVEEDGRVRVAPTADPDDCALAPDELEDFAARRFGSIVLCVGPASGDWPSDVELLDGAFHPRSGRFLRWVRARRASRATAVAGGVAVALAVVAALCWAVLAHRAPPPTTIEMAKARIQRTLDGIKPAALRVDVVGDKLHVEGLVDTALQAAQARAAILEQRGRHPVNQRFAAADDVADAFRAALGAESATITHDGRGGFAIVAAVPNATAARQVVDRLRADLGPVVRSVDARFESVGAKSEAPILSRMSSDGLSFVQTRDGVKHLSMRSADDSPVTVSDALSLPTLLTPAPAPAPAGRSIAKEKP